MAKNPIPVLLSLLYLPKINSLLIEITKTTMKHDYKLISLGAEVSYKKPYEVTKI